MNKYLISIYGGNGPQALAHLLSQGNQRRQWLEEALVIVLMDVTMAKEERLQFAEMLLCSGASPDVFTSDHQPIICWAVEHDDLDTVELLLNFDIDVDARDDEGWTSLHHCANSGLSHITSVLLAAGADPDIRDEDGDTALSVAFVTQTPNWDVVELLLIDTNVNLSNYFSESPLIKLALHNRSPLVMQAVPRLIQQGANVNAQNMGGDTALMLAATINGGHLDLVMVLLEAGSDVNIKDHSGHTVLHLVAMHANKLPHSQQRCRDLTKALINAGADINIVTDNDIHHLPPLGFALMNKNWLVMKELLQSNCDPVPAGSIVRPFVLDPSMDPGIIDGLEYLMVDAAPGGFLEGWMEYHKVLWTSGSQDFRIDEACAPLPLIRLCRCRLRQVLPSGRAFHSALERLELPISIKRFIALQTGL